MPQAIVALGSNLGDRLNNIQTALSKMQNYQIKIGKISSFIETPPYGYTEQGSFLNGGCVINTELSPQVLLRTLLDIEQEMGRIRGIRWGPRKIDLDIIFYEDLIIQGTDLTIPHPDAHNRAFVMGPIAEIVPNYIHPIFHKTVKEIYEELINCHVRDKE